MKMTDKSEMPFGKYKGVALADVPDSYFIWLWEQDSFQEKKGELYDYIKENIDAMKNNVKYDKSIKR